jgi:hypothetical protein
MKAKDRMLERQGRLSHKRLLEVLSYDPVTGVFKWLVSTSNRAPTGSVAGSVREDGIYITVDGTRFLAHRLAWFYANGVWPSDQLDHRDLDQTNNRIRNLRESTQGQNCCNVKIRRHCRSGIKGAHWHGQSGRWMAQIRVDNKRIYLGIFATPQEAGAVYAVASAKYHGDFGRVS